MPTVSRGVVRKSRGRPTSAALVVACALASSGCYAYVPPASGRSLVEQPVQLLLTDSGTVVLMPFVGPSIGAVEGRLIADSGGVYSMRVTRTTRRDGTEADWRGEPVAIAHVLVSSIAIRRFSYGRTALFSALTTGALVFIAEAFTGGGGATTPGGTPTGPPTGR